jgi:hypothetical protein
MMASNDESIEQLEDILELLDLYPEIHPAAAAKLYDWLDLQPIAGNGKTWNQQPRQKQASQLIDWFERMISEQEKGLTI